MSPHPAWTTRHPRGLAGAMLAGLILAGAAGVAAQDTPRAHYDFEADTAGFHAIAVRNNQLGPDGDSQVTVARGGARAGEGALQHTCTIAPGVVRALAADLRLPAATRSLRFWMRGDFRSHIVVALREEDGSGYQRSFYLPAHEWTKVAVNLDELILDEGAADENGRLDVDQVRHITFTDFAGVLLQGGADLERLVTGPRRRTFLLDELHFSPEAAPVGSGPVMSPSGRSLLLDSADAPGVRWLPIRISTTNNPPSLEFCPENISLQVLPEAAGPGGAPRPDEPGGKGLRYAYRRGEGDAFALNLPIRHPLLAQADRLRLSMNLSARSLYVIQLKERDESGYNYLVMPDNSVGWQNLEIPFSEMRLAEDSQDENNQLDADQIKEITVLDASIFLQLPGGDITLELDAVRLGLK